MREQIGVGGIEPGGPVNRECAVRQVLLHGHDCLPFGLGLKFRRPGEGATRVCAATTAVEASFSLRGGGYPSAPHPNLRSASGSAPRQWRAWSLVAFQGSSGPRMVTGEAAVDGFFCHDSVRREL